MAGCAFGVAVRVELGPSAMILERGVASMWSISSRNGLQVRGKADTHRLAMPMRCTPWPAPENSQSQASGGEDQGRKKKPGKKRAVLGRDFAVAECHLVQLGLLGDVAVLCGSRKARCRRWGLQLLPSQSRPRVWVSCFIS